MPAPLSHLARGLVAALLAINPAAALCPLNAACAPAAPRPDVAEVLQEQAARRALMQRQQQEAVAATMERQREAAAYAAVEQREHANREAFEWRQQQAEQLQSQQRRQQEERLELQQHQAEQLQGQQRHQAERLELQQRQQQEERLELQQRQQQEERGALEQQRHPNLADVGRPGPLGLVPPPPFALGGHLPRGFDPDRHRLDNYAHYHLHPPGPRQIWLVYPPYFLLLDSASGTILDTVPDTALSPSLDPFYNVGIAWSAGGGWATRTGATLADAETKAINACSAEGQPCTNAGLPISADAPACYALVRSGTALYGAVEVDTATATDAALQRCANAGGTACTLQVANCNDHP